MIIMLFTNYKRKKIKSEKLNLNKNELNIGDINKNKLNNDKLNKDALNKDKLYKVMPKKDSLKIEKRYKNKALYHKLMFLCLLTSSLFILTACVDQSQKTHLTTNTSNQEADKSPVILATSMATVEICEKLDIPLAGIPDSSLYEPPEVYKDLPKIGTAMSPDMEIVASMKPKWILSPVSLISDLRPKYEAIHTEYAFLNLNSVEGMYHSILELGILFDREEKATALVKEFTDFYKGYIKEVKGKKEPTVLILMGLPGSYVVATEKSYVGSLVKLAGGINIYQGEEKDFINVNTEDMLKKEPDIILRTAHALPDEVMDMFAEEFKTNDIWKNFRAVKEKKVYDLSYERFGMSANFKYSEALKDLKDIFYSNE